MKANHPEARKHTQGKPFEVVKEGSISIPIYAHKNVIPQRDPVTRAILYTGASGGEQTALVKYEHTIYTVAYYEGRRRVRRKFSSLVEARREAELAAVKLANGETEALRLTGADRADYVRAMQRLRGGSPTLTSTSPLPITSLRPGDCRTTPASRRLWTSTSSAILSVCRQRPSVKSGKN